MIQEHPTSEEPQQGIAQRQARFQRLKPRPVVRLLTHRRVLWQASLPER
jgi:hypothetical protein